MGTCRRYVTLLAALLGLALPAATPTPEELFHQAVAESAVVVPLAVLQQASDSLADCVARLELYLDWLAFFEAHGLDAPKNMALAGFDREWQLLKCSLSVATYRRWHERLPGDVVLRNSLAWKLLMAEDGAEEAVALLKGVASGAAQLDTLAWAYYRLGRPVEALQLILAAMEEVHAHSDVEETCPIVYDHAGDIFSRLGQYHEARLCYSRARRLAHNFPVRLFNRRFPAERQLQSAEDAMILQGYNDAQTARKLRAVNRLLKAEAQRQGEGAQ